MKDFFSKIKDKFSTSEDNDFDTEGEEDYIEINPVDVKEKSKITVKPHIINDFSDIKQPLDDLREGYTISLLNIRPLKDKDIIELKRAVNKLKKTCDAINGDIAGFGEDWIVITPSFARVYRNAELESKDL